MSRGASWLFIVAMLASAAAGCVDAADSPKPAASHDGPHTGIDEPTGQANVGTAGQFDDEVPPEPAPPVPAAEVAMGPTDVRITASHGSIWVAVGAALEGAVVELARGAEVITWTLVQNGTAFFGFLEPATEYIVHISNQEMSTHTLPAAVPYAPWDAAAVQPGMKFWTRYWDNQSGCTLAFLARDATNETLYAFTAAHCLHNGDGQAATHVEFRNGTRIGRVAAIGDFDDPEFAADWGLIEINDEYRPLLHPGIRSLGGPFDGGDRVPGGSQLCYVGNSDYADAGLERRCGPLLDQDTWQREDYIYFIGPGASGDSGAPIITASGHALAILNAGVPPTSMAGVAVCWALERAADMGFELRLLADPGAILHGVEAGLVPRVPGIGGSACTAFAY